MEVMKGQKQFSVLPGFPSATPLSLFTEACYPVFRYYSMNKFRVIVMKFNCSLGTWSHYLKGNQYLSAGYMIRKLQLLGVHDFRRWSVWRRCFKAFHIFNLYSVLFDPLLYPLSLLLAFCNVTNKSSSAYQGEFSGVHFTAGHILM